MEVFSFCACMRVFKDTRDVQLRKKDIMFFLYFEKIILVLVYH